MKNTKQILMITILIFNICACKKNANSNNNMPQMSQGDIMLFKKIKDRTEHDLKKLGIKRVLIVDNGWWFDGVTLSYQFNLNGKIYISEKGRQCGFGYWKVEYNKLFINPNKNIYLQNRNKYYQMVVETVDSFSHSAANLNRIKYALIIYSNDTDGFGFTISK